MTKLITLVAVLYLFTFTVADQETIINTDLNFDDFDDDSVLSTEPLFIDVAEGVDIKAIEEASKVEVNNGFEPVEPIETGEDLTLTIIEEETMIPLVEETDLQGPIVVDGGEVIVDYVENGETVQAVLQEEEEKTDYVDNGELIIQVEDDITAVQEEEEKIDYVENGELIVQVEDDITAGEVTNTVLVENEEEGVFTEVIANPGEPGDDEEEEFKNNEADIANQGEIPVLVLENTEEDVTEGEITNVVLVENEEGGFTAVIANPGEPGDDEEEEFKTEEADIANQSEIPVLVIESTDDITEGEVTNVVLVDNEEESEITAVIIFADVRADDEEEESFIDSQESDDANEGEIPVLPEESEIAQVLANPGLPGDDEEEEADISSQESDDANEGEIPILPDEQEVTQGFVEPDVKADDEEEEPIETDEPVDGEPVVVFPEDQAGEDGVTPGVVVTQDFSDDAGEEQGDDVDERDDYEPDGGAADSAIVSERGFLGRN